MAGVIPRLAKIAPRPVSLFQHHFTADAPTVATTTPATAEMMEQIRGNMSRVLCAPYNPRRSGCKGTGESEQMAPSISYRVPKTTACLYETEREDALAAHAFASVLGTLERSKFFRHVLAPLLFALGYDKECANSKYKGVNIQHRLGYYRKDKGKK
ncbi:hypothetical protein RJZ56_007135 [Blastomyces dermatitidis]